MALGFRLTPLALLRVVHRKALEPSRLNERNVLSASVANEDREDEGACDSFPFDSFPFGAHFSAHFSSPLSSSFPVLSFCFT